MKKIAITAAFLIGFCSISHAATHQRITDDVIVTTHDNGTTTTHQRVTDDVSINMHSNGGSSTTHRITDDTAITTQLSPWTKPASPPSIFDQPSKPKGGNDSVFDNNIFGND